MGVGGVEEIELSKREGKEGEERVREGLGVG